MQQHKEKDTYLNIEKEGIEERRHPNIHEQDYYHHNSVCNNCIRQKKYHRK